MRKTRKSATKCSTERIMSLSPERRVRPRGARRRPTSILPQHYLLSKYNSSSITGDRGGQIRPDRQTGRMSERAAGRKREGRGDGRGLRWVVGDDKESQIKPRGCKRVPERGDQSR